MATFSITWQAVTGFCTLLTFIGVGLALYVKFIVRAELNGVFERINGTYTRAKQCSVLHDQLEQRFRSLETRIDMVEEKVL